MQLTSGIVLTVAVATGCGTGGDDTGGGVDQDEAAASIAQAHCAALFDCDCSPADYSDQATCEEELTAALGGVIQAAADAGLTYDGTCTADWIAMYEAYGCGSWREIDRFSDSFAARAAVMNCKMFSGSVAKDESCEPVDPSYTMAGDSCVAAIECISGLCQIDWGLREPGAVCHIDGDDLFYSCVPGYTCSASEETPDLLCLESLAEGDACDVGSAQCDSFSTGRVCEDASMTCQPPPSAGEPCNFQCDNDAYCDASDGGTCQARVPIGEGCEPDQFGIQCTLDAECVDDVCEAAPAQVCVVDPLDTLNG